VSRERDSSDPSPGFEMKMNTTYSYGGAKFYITKQGVYGMSLSSFPILRRGRPKAAICDTCQDTNLLFYLPPKRVKKENCLDCDGRGLAAIPMTELFNILDKEVEL
jgi:hypothetical protein